MKHLYFLLSLFCLSNTVLSQVIVFPDPNLKAKLLLSSTTSFMALDSNDNKIKIDANGNNEIEVSEAQLVYKLNVEYGAGMNYSYRISNFTGISNFSSLRELRTVGNNAPSLDVSSLSMLETLNCREATLTSLNVNGLSLLTSLECQSNALTTLNISSLVNLQVIDCSNNYLTTLDATNADLVYINCRTNYLTALNLGVLPNLTQLLCNNNQLTTLDISGMNSLMELYCHNNQFTILDINNKTQLTHFDASGNPLLEVILMKNCGLNANNIGFGALTLSTGSDSHLRYICIEDEKRSTIASYLTSHDIVGVIVNSYCTFGPSGVFYVINGNIKYDFNFNGCDASDPSNPDIRLSINNSGNFGAIFPNALGNYYLPVQGGTHTIIPVIENPSYFDIYPPNVPIQFPSNTSPYTQNFCITPNGVHPDLEIIIIPVSSARPGFDVTLKIKYRNRGTNVQSGSINFVFNDAVLDFISSNPIVASQALNTLSWNYTNLSPFETREILITLNLNSPVEDLPVTGGYILNYTASISSPAVEETPNDNIFDFRQVVSNSFDPNDKTCIEGATITPSMVGKYVHYKIRFENTGSANATNIVVQDIIDLSKFDINSLAPIDSSHPFVTKISNTNTVAFIFENINLPFADGANDGYVAFRIKTKPTLVEGNTFSNSASIFFDYNAPIITNTAVTTVAALANSNFQFETYFKVYPNPVSSVLNIEVKKQIYISEISIYNALGQIVLLIPNAKDVNAVDVSNLKTGNYFIKIQSDKGTSNTKFMKD